MEQLKLFDEDAIDIMANEVQEFWDEIAPSLDETQQRELDRALLDLLHFSFHYIEMSNTDDKYDKNMNPNLNLDTLPKWIKMETTTNERTRETQPDCYFWSDSPYNIINHLGDYYFYNYHADGIMASVRRDTLIEIKENK